jgi:hypothetical protein
LGSACDDRVPALQIDVVHISSQCQTTGYQAGPDANDWAQLLPREQAREHIAAE